MKQNSQRFEQTLLFAFLLIFWTLTHTWGLRWVPGFHFDEAWAAMTAVHILENNYDKGIMAQSPYTSIWSHLWAILFTWPIGLNLYTFRLSQIFLSLCGVLLIVRSSEVKHDLPKYPLYLHRRAGFLFLFLSGLLTVIVSNHRLAIELSGFHVVCLGALVFGVSKFQQKTGQLSATLFITLGAILGLTSHILFLAPTLGLLFTRLTYSSQLSPLERWSVGGIASVLGLFSLRILILIPEKEKALGLLALSLIFVFWAWKSGRRPRLKYQKKLEKGVLLLSTPFLAYLLFFADGHWNVFVATGQVRLFTFIGFPLAIMAGFVMLNLQEGLKDHPSVRFFARWTTYSTLFTGLMMLSPENRYFHLPLLLALITFCLFIANIYVLKRLYFIVLLTPIALGQLYWNYYQPARAGALDRSVHLGFIKGSSSDYLNIQLLARELSEKGCRYQDSVTGDPRIRERLDFLSRSQVDWPQPSHQAAWCQGWRVGVKRTNDQSVLPRPQDILLEKWGYTVWKNL